MSDIRGRILDLLKRNARITNAQLAARLKTKEAVVQKEIRAMEAEGILRGYTAIVNEEDEKAVRAIIEVEVQPERDCGFDRIAQAIAKFPEVVSMYLVSGRYDLRIEVVGKSLRDVADFINSCDVKITNLETNLSDFEYYAGAYSGGTWLNTRRACLDDLLRYGFNYFGNANNHAFDYSYNGLLSTIDTLDSKPL